MLNFNFSEKCLQSVASFSAIFCVWFFKKNISLVKISSCDCLYLSRFWTICVIAIICWPGCNVIKFEINLIFLIKTFCATWPKIQNKEINILRMTRAFGVKWEAVIIIFKGFSVTKIVSDLRVTPNFKSPKNNIRGPYSLGDQLVHKKNTYSYDKK